MFGLGRNDELDHLDVSLGVYELIEDEMGDLLAEGAVSGNIPLSPNSEIYFTLESITKTDDQTIYDYTSTWVRRGR